jgi:hypothetical protein
VIITSEKKINTAEYKVCVNIIHTINSYQQLAQWLRYCATNQIVSGSIPDDVIENFL